MDLFIIKIHGMSVVNKMADKCGWMLEFDGEYHMSSCEQNFIFYEDGPIENGFKFCPFCGKEIVIDEGGE